MNVRHLVPSVSRRILFIGSLLLAAGLQQPVHASGVDLSKFKRIEPQFIAALGDPGATSGKGAQSWGFWNQDPGPRACKLDHYHQLKAVSAVLLGVATDGNSTLRTGGWRNMALIMEKPTFPLAPGKYLVTGDREVTTVLDNSAQGQGRQSAVGTRRRRNPQQMSPIRRGCRSARYTH